MIPVVVSRTNRRSYQEMDALCSEIFPPVPLTMATTMSMVQAMNGSTDLQRGTSQPFCRSETAATAAAAAGVGAGAGVISAAHASTSGKTNLHKNEVGYYIIWA